MNKYKDNMDNIGFNKKNINLNLKIIKNNNFNKYYEKEPYTCPYKSKYTFEQILITNKKFF